MAETNKIPIKFGTDGWRGVIARDFTFSNVAAVSQAVADYINRARSPKRAVVGFDNRFLSDRFAGTVAAVLSANGIEVGISSTAVTSPSISNFCRISDSYGIMITASHNPPEWNGLKIKLQYGGSVSEDVIEKISSFVGKNRVRTGDKEIQKKDVLEKYVKYLKSLVKLKEKHGCKIVVDCMHGSGSGIFERLVSCGVTSINSRRDPLFSGVNPEPIEKNLAELKKSVVATGAFAGFALDGDADRIGVVDDTGRYLPPHIVFPLLLLHLAENRKLSGRVVQTVSLGYLSERIARKYSLPFKEISIGFKYVCQEMLSGDVLIGGEESGGYGWKGGLPERDGVANALLLCEMLFGTGKKLSALVDELQDRFGRSCFLRTDIKLAAPIDKDKFTRFVKSAFHGSRGVRELRTFDGVKIIFDNDDWLLLRPSGTEPVLRTYSETSSQPKTRRMLVMASEIANNYLRAGSSAGK
jgi:phosphomannomutase